MVEKIGGGDTEEVPPPTVGVGVVVPLTPDTAKQVLDDELPLRGVVPSVPLRTLHFSCNE